MFDDSPMSDSSQSFDYADANDSDEDEPYFEVPADYVWTDVHGRKHGPSEGWMA